MKSFFCWLFGFLPPGEKRFRAVFKCVKCRAELSQHERVYNNGVCPHCGNASEGTIVAASKESVCDV